MGRTASTPKAVFYRFCLSHIILVFPEDLHVLSDKDGEIARVAFRLLNIEGQVRSVPRSIKQ